MFNRRLITPLAFYVALVAILATFGLLRSWAAICVATAVLAAAINLIANIDGCISFVQRLVRPKTPKHQGDQSAAGRMQPRRKPRFFGHPDPAVRAGRIAIVGLVFGVPLVFYAQALIQSSIVPEVDLSQAIAKVPKHEVTPPPVQEMEPPSVVASVQPPLSVPPEIADALMEIKATMEAQKAAEAEKKEAVAYQETTESEAAESKTETAPPPQFPERPKSTPPIDDKAPENFDNVKVVQFSFPKSAISRRVENQVDETQAVVQVAGVLHRLWIQTPGYEFAPGTVQPNGRPAAGIVWCGAGRPSSQIVQMAVSKWGSKGWVSAELNFDGIDESMYEVEHNSIGPSLVTVEKRGFKSLGRR